MSDSEYASFRDLRDYIITRLREAGAHQYPVAGVCLDVHAERAFLKATTDEVGDLVGRLIQEGPRSFTTAWGYPVTWDAATCDVLVTTETGERTLADALAASSV